MTLLLKFEFVLEILISFALVYFYATEINNRHFLCFSNNQCVTVWDTYIIPDRYYGLILPSEYAEININKHTNIYLLKTSNEILMTEPSKNSILNNKIKIIQESHSPSYDSFSLWIDTDPIPTFFLAKNNKTIRNNLLFITPIISFFLSSTIPFIITLFIVGMIKYYKFSISKTYHSIKEKIILLFKIIAESIFVVIVIMGISLIFFIGTI